MDRPNGQDRPVLKRDRELEAGARAHFEDPSYYTTTYANRTEDVAYYVRLARRHDVVLEHGIGNGRIAIPIARTETEVWGIDHSREMIGDLKTRLRHELPEVAARVRARVGDIRRARFSTRYPLVMCPFNTALHLYTRKDVERWLANVTAQLAPNGELVFDVAMPVIEDLARKPGVPYRTPGFTYPGKGRVSYEEYFDYDRVRQILFVSMGFTTKGGDSFMTPLAHRQFYPQELEALLHYNGFDVRALFGDFERGPLTKDSDVMVVHARRRRR